MERKYAFGRRWLESQVLVADGVGNAESAEIYDPANGAWSAIGDMRTPRYWHSATLLGDGTILLAGGTGWDGIPFETELYNPKPESTEGMTLQQQNG